MALAISTIESELEQAQEALKVAGMERERATRNESQWLTVVESLKRLLDVKRAQEQPQDEVSTALPFVETVPSPSGESTISHVEWIAGLIKSANSLGMSPPEIHQRAEVAKIKMHRNYPYVVLKSLVEKGRVTKRDGRYYATDKL